MPAAYLPEAASVVLQELDYFRRDLLAVTALYEPDDPNHDGPYGEGLRQALEELYDRSVTKYRVYNGLADLVDLGLLRTTDADGQATYYEFTDRGREALAGYAYFVACAADIAGADVAWPHEFATRPDLPPAWPQWQPWSSGVDHDPTKGGDER